MAVAADSIRHLTRAVIGARVYQSVIFWLALAHNVKAFLVDVGYPDPAVQIGLTFGALVVGGAVGSYFQWRFGRVEPVKAGRSRRPFEDFKYGVIGATALVLLTLVALIAIFGFGREAGAKPVHLAGLLISAGTAWSLASSRGEPFGWLIPLLASTLLLATLVVPILQPYLAIGHAGMAGALIVTAIQLHLFVVRGFRSAHV